MRITEENPDPVDEYSGEASEIARRVMVALRTPQVVDQVFIASVVSDVFRSEFEVEIESTEAIQIASRIEAALD
jgi:hypothetical protein